MQFSSVFELFTRTLYLAWAAVASTAIAIVIFLMGFCFAVVTINGNNSKNFNRFIKSMVMCMCFSFGFSAQVKPSELFHGGKWLGILLYGVLAFVIIVLLINVFVSLINDYFTIAKTMRDSETDHRINFFEFLRVEFSGFFRCIQNLPCCRRNYVRNNRTVAQNVNRKLDEMDAKKAMKQRQRRGYQVIHRESGDDAQSAYKDRGERIINVGNILSTQLTLLSMLLFNDDEEEQDQPEPQDFETDVEGGKTTEPQKNKTDNEAEA